MSPSINLGDAESYSIYGASSVTNTGPTIIDGNLGTGGTSVTGFFPPGIVNGNIATGGATSTVFIDATTAFTDISALNPDADLTGQDLGNRNLLPGTYKYSTAAQLTGILTLQGTGSLDDAWYFQIGSALTTASGSAVIFSNGALACQVYWVLGTSATLGTGSSFIGTILAGASVTFNTGASLIGRAFGLSATVTLDSNAVILPAACPVPSSLSSVAQQTPASSVASSLLSSSTSNIFLSTTLSSQTQISNVCDAIVHHPARYIASQRHIYQYAFFTPHKWTSVNFFDIIFSLRFGVVVW
ncbi:hypothetical protein BKA64DRAFT_707900 [Cadophora sp. MPI-SDFR-AT-0126]|nr:hypothetical protein BKA64DRAFT_707900 [Leotiomycetes sp. MPI-SDFR-AT-0126]